MAIVPFKFEGDAASVVAAYQTIQEQIKKTRSVRRESADEGNRLADQTLSGLQNMVMGWASIGAIIGAATNAVREYNRALDEAAQKRQAAFPAEARLAQVAGTPAEMQRLVKETAAAYGAGGFASRGEAAGLVGELGRAGALGERPFFARLQGMEDATGLVRGAAGLRAAMGAGETGSLRALVSKGMAAAAPVPGATAAQMLQAAPGAAESAQMLGLSDEELLAAISVLSETGEGPAAAAAGAQALFKGFVKQGIPSGGRGLAGYMENIRGRNLEPRQLLSFFGRPEGALAYQHLAGGDLAGRLAAIRGAEATDLAGMKVGLVEGIPELAAARGAGAGAAALETARDPQAAIRNLANAALSAKVQGGLGTWREGLDVLTQSLLPASRAGAAVLGRATEFDISVIRSRGTEEQKAVLEKLIAALEENTKATLGNTQSSGGPGGALPPPAGE